MQRLLVWLVDFVNWLMQFLPSPLFRMETSLNDSTTMSPGIISENLDIVERENNNSIVPTESRSEGNLNYPLAAERQQWSNLPCDILEQIVERLGIIEILGVRGTCREWRHLALASKDSVDHHHSTSITTTTSQAAAQGRLWFLLYGKDEYPNCALYDPCSEKLYNKINIPELGKGVDCIASKYGWLLLYRNSNRSLFFFCPFSRAKIDLPNLPNVDEGLSRRIAAFSSPPTSPDCVVCVCTQTAYMPQALFRSYSKFVLNVLRRGANNNEWDGDEREFRHNPIRMHIARCATFRNGVVYFIDKYKNGVGFSLEENQWVPLPVVREFSVQVRGNLYGSEVRRRLSLGRFDYFSICGAVDVESNDGDDDDGYLMTYMNDEDVLDARSRLRDRIDTTKPRADLVESGLMSVLLRFLHLVDDSDKFDVRKEYKGVWLQPRFIQLPHSNYYW